MTAVLLAQLLQKQNSELGLGILAQQQQSPPSSFCQPPSITSTVISQSNLQNNVDTLFTSATISTLPAPPQLSKINNLVTSGSKNRTQQQKRASVSGGRATIGSPIASEMVKNDNEQCGVIQRQNSAKAAELIIGEDDSTNANNFSSEQPIWVMRYGLKLIPIF